MAGSHSTAYLVLGKLYKEKEMFDLAEKYFKLCADEKDNKEAQRELCQLYNHQKNSALEEKYLKLIINNGDLKSFVILAEKYTEKNRYEEALELYKKIEDKISFCLGEIYLNTNKLSSAEEYLKIAVENEYGSEAIQLLGTVYEKQNNLGLAKKYYSETNTEEAKNRLNIIEQKENLIKNL